jgi:CRP-like cAMP-binding protein
MPSMRPGRAAAVTSGALTSAEPETLRLQPHIATATAITPTAVAVARINTFADCIFNMDFTVKCLSGSTSMQGCRADCYIFATNLTKKIA